MLRNSGQAAGNAYSESADERELFFLGLPGRGLSASKAPYMPDAEGSPSASLLFARLSADLAARSERRRLAFSSDSAASGWLEISTLSRSSRPVRKLTTLVSPISTILPVLGFLPERARLFLTVRLPKPLISILSPSARASVMRSSISLTASSITFCEKHGFRLSLKTGKHCPICRTPDLLIPAHLHNLDGIMPSTV